MFMWDGETQAPTRSEQGSGLTSRASGYVPTELLRKDEHGTYYLNTATGINYGSYAPGHVMVAQAYGLYNIWVTWKLDRSIPVIKSPLGTDWVRVEQVNWPFFARLLRQLQGKKTY